MLWYTVAKRINNDNTSDCAEDSICRGYRSGRVNSVNGGNILFEFSVHAWRLVDTGQLHHLRQQCVYALTLCRCAVANAAALTIALLLDKPALCGMFPVTTTFIPDRPTFSGSSSLIPWTPHKKYLYHRGPSDTMSILRKSFPNIRFTRKSIFKC